MSLVEVTSSVQSAAYNNTITATLKGSDVIGPLTNSVNACPEVCRFRHDDGQLRRAGCWQRLASSRQVEMVFVIVYRLVHGLVCKPLSIFLVAVGVLCLQHQCVSLYAMFQCWSTSMCLDAWSHSCTSPLMPLAQHSLRNAQMVLYRIK